MPTGTKSLYSAAIVAAATLAFTSAAEAAGSLDGVYVGAKMARDQYHADTSFAYTDGFDAGATNLDGLSLEGFSGAIFAGYDLEVNRWHLAIEGEYGFGDAQVRRVEILNGSEIVNQLIEARQSYGATARYGYEVIDGALLYGRTGWVRTKLNADPGGSAWLDGLRAGIGVEMAISSQVSIRSEYLYTNYERYSDSFTSGSYAFTAQMDATSDAFSLGVAVHF